MQSIAVFNNKGGVGKTTFLCNLSAFLSIDRGRKILVVDADPQCNATQSIFDENELLKIYNLNHSSFTIHSIIKPLESGKGYSSEIEPLFSKNFNIYVLPGDQRLALTEDLLAEDWGSATSGKIRGLRTTFLFKDLLSKCDEYDFVLFDVGPSLGSINRAVLLACDFFITPMSIDIFSIQAVENIAKSFLKWRRELEDGIRKLEDPSELDGLDTGWRLKFAGYVTQQYTAKKDSEGNRRAVTAYDRIMKRIPKIIEQEFVKKLQSPHAALDYYLGSIPNFHSLVPLSQTNRKPIFGLKAADGVVGAHFAKVRDFNDIMADISKKLLQNLESLS